MIGLRLSVDEQVNDLAVDLRVMQALAQAGSPHARGAALAAAHATLILAVSAVADEDLQMIRQESVVDAMPALTRAGLGHVVPLLKAALAVDIVAHRLARGVERLQ